MSLINHVAEELGLEEGDITGKWDTAHVMQIVWNKVLTNKMKMNNLIHIHFDIMNCFRLGKASTLFQNRAR